MSLTVRKNQDWSEVNVTLNNPEASEEVAGIIQVASSSDVNLAESSKKAVTPLSLGKGQANGVAKLDGDAKIPFNSLPIVVSTRKATVEDEAAIWFSI